MNVSKVYLSLIIAAAMSAAAAISWVVKPEPLPEQLPPEVIRVETVKEIPSPPDTKIVERIKVVTLPAPPAETVIQEVVKEVQAGYPPDGRVTVELDKYAAQDGWGWKGTGKCEVLIGGEWKVLYENPIDLTESEAITTIKPIVPLQKKHIITFGYDLQDSYLLSYQRKTNLSSRYKVIDTLIPDGMGGTIVKTPSDTLIFATVSFEF